MRTRGFETGNGGQHGARAAGNHHALALQQRRAGGTGHLHLGGIDEPGLTQKHMYARVNVTLHRVVRGNMRAHRMHPLHGDGKIGAGTGRC